MQGVAVLIKESAKHKKLCESRFGYVIVNILDFCPMWSAQTKAFQCLVTLESFKEDRS